MTWFKLRRRYGIEVTMACIWNRKFRKDAETMARVGTRYGVMEDWIEASMFCIVLEERTNPSRAATGMPIKITDDAAPIAFHILVGRESFMKELC